MSSAMLKPAAGVTVPVAPARRYHRAPPAAVLASPNAAPNPFGVASAPLTKTRCAAGAAPTPRLPATEDRKSTRLNSSHLVISYAVFCLKKKKKQAQHHTPVTG